MVADLSPAELSWRPGPAANSIGWLVWHLARVQDDHVAHVGQVDQVWPHWADRFELPYPLDDIGYGHTSDQVAALTLADAALLTRYHADVHALTVHVVKGLDSAAFARIVDRRWNPPVTAAVRLVSVVNDITQHLGQAAYLRGLLDRPR